MSEFVARIEREMFGRRRTRAQIWTRRISVAILLMLVPCLIAEIILRASGFQRPQIPMSVQATTNAAAAAALNSRLETDSVVPDRYLLWRLEPAGNIGGIPVNTKGLLGPETLDRPASGTTRLLTLGDSTPALLCRTWPEITEKLVNASIKGRIEVINASVPGYTTEQGLRWFRHLRRLKPHIVLICYGWNDRFPALNLPDKELGARSAVSALMHRMFHRMRLYQYLSAPRDAVVAEDEPTTAQMRVGPRQYERNLIALVTAVRDSGATAVLMTQPAHLTSDSLAHLEQEAFADAGEAVTRRHDEYNRIIRRVAADTQTLLLDVEEEFDRRNKQFLFDPDGIHLAGPGHNHVARLVIGLLRNAGVISGDEFNRIVRLARYDTTAPDKPHAAWALNPSQVQVQTTGTAQVGVIATNTGNTKWLRSDTIKRFGSRTDVKYGGVFIAGHWRTQGATTAPTAISRLPHDILPGESTSQTLTITPPPDAGVYEMEIGLEADGVGPLSALGAEVTTLTVTVTAP
ncbi:MAG: SGNH/GDSL hydrolase family protein [Candidatus Sumerlaeaceae bacterium]|nr:SGNH/GDSL hydrolase family protein [Candidatus Sumerlaeaceae bacterium]